MAFSYFTKTMAATATLTSAYDLSPRGWPKCYLDVPTMASASDFYIQASVTETGTYRRITAQDPNQATDFKIASSVTNRIVPIPTGFRYVKVEASTANTAALNFNIICGDDQ